MPDPDALEIHREMGCTREELVAWLPGATRGAPARTQGNTVTVQVDGGEVEIAVRAQPARRLGGVALPVLSVTIRFIGVDAAAREEFLRYFDLYTRRGGG